LGNGADLEHEEAGLNSKDAEKWIRLSDRTPAVIAFRRRGDKRKDYVNGTRGLFPLSHGVLCTYRTAHRPIIQHEMDADGRGHGSDKAKRG
jgi:hypothetical protein